jgi:polysaccharide export outer membrane protein
MKTTALVFACVFCLSISALAQKRASTPSETVPHFFVAGEVRHPGMFEYREGMSVMAALARAEGLTVKADHSSAILYRKDQTTGKRSPIQIDLTAMMKSKAEWLMLQPDDYLIILTTDNFFVGGEVKQPGRIEYGKGLTVLPALALAGGVTEAAQKQAVIFRQEQPDAKRVEIKVDLEAVMKGQAEDIPLLPDDIVLVPKQRR